MRGNPVPPATPPHRDADPPGRDPGLLRTLAWATRTPPAPPLRSS